MKIGFIGLGNMATAMIGGMLQKGIAKPEDIIGSSKTEATAEKVKSKFNIKILMHSILMIYIIILAIYLDSKIHSFI